MKASPIMIIAALFAAAFAGRALGIANAAATRDDPPPAAAKVAPMKAPMKMASAESETSDAAKAKTMMAQAPTEGAASAEVKQAAPEFQRPD